MTYALDASAIIAHLDSDDAHHALVRAMLEEAARERFLAHPLTVAECLVAAVRAGRGADMADAITQMGVDVVDVDGGCPLRLAELRVVTGLRLPDCCPIDVARFHGGTLLTLDQRQATGARAVGVEVESGTPPSRGPGLGT